MKQLLLTLSFCAIACITHAQADSIYRLVFSDTSNFRLTTLMDHKMPPVFYIQDTTIHWRPDAFVMEGIDLDDPDQLRKLKRHEHHPYNYFHLFRDTLLNRHFTKEEKAYLKKTSLLQVSQKIKLKGPHWATRRHPARQSGFYFLTTAPVFNETLDKAVIWLILMHKEKDAEEPLGSFFGTTFIVFQKDAAGTWRKLRQVNHLVL